LIRFQLTYPMCEPGIDDELFQGIRK
jgi:hypothetical protein